MKKDLVGHLWSLLGNQLIILKTNEQKGTIKYLSFFSYKLYIKVTQ